MDGVKDWGGGWIVRGGVRTVAPNLSLRRHVIWQRLQSWNPTYQIAQLHKSVVWIAERALATEALDKSCK